MLAVHWLYRLPSSIKILFRLDDFVLDKLRREAITLKQFAPTRSLFTDNCLLRKMPLYEYRCNPCGEFEAWRSMAEYNAPLNCPKCDLIATKIFSAPNINLNSGSFSAIAPLAVGNARSQSSEPRLVKREQKEPAKPRYQTSTSNRPWMVSHAPERL